MFDSDLFVTNACAMMLRKIFHYILFMFYAFTQIDVEVSLTNIAYWFINILSNHDIKCADDDNDMKEWRLV